MSLGRMLGLDVLYKFTNATPQPMVCNNATLKICKV